MMNTGDNFGFTSQSTGQVQDDLSSTGVSILSFKSESIARKARMQKGDVIVEYDGKRNLTTDKLMALTTVTKPEGTQTRVAFVRDGHAHSIVVPTGPLGISVLDTTIRTSSGQDFWDSFSSDVINRLKRLGLGFLGAYLVLVLLTLGAAAAGFLLIGSWDNLVILLMMILVPALLLGFLYYLIGEFVMVPRAQLSVVALFLVGLVVPALISRSQDSKVILELMILSCAAFFVLLCCAIHFIPSLRERKGVFLGMGIGMWTGFGVNYALWGPTWGSYSFSWLATACIAIGGYFGHKIVDKKSKR